MDAPTQSVVTASRYHPVLVTLHWALALLIIVALAGGALKMAPMANTNPMKLEALRVHMTGGILGDFANPAALLFAAMPVRLRRGRPTRRRTTHAFIQPLSPETSALARSPGSAARCATDRRRG